MQDALVASGSNPHINFTRVCQLSCPYPDGHSDITPQSRVLSRAVGRSPEVRQRSLLWEPLKLSPFPPHLPLQVRNVELGHWDTNCAPLW